VYDWDLVGSHDLLGSVVLRGGELSHPDGKAKDYVLARDESKVPRSHRYLKAHLVFALDIEVEKEDRSKGLDVETLEEVRGGGWRLFAPRAVKKRAAVAVIGMIVVAAAAVVVAAAGGGLLVLLLVLLWCFGAMSNRKHRVLRPNLD